MTRKSRRLPDTVDRRTFMGAGAAAVGLAMRLGESLLVDPYRPLRRRVSRGRPVRVRGRVQSDGRGVPRTGVTDGQAVVETAADGTFELVTSDDRAFLTVCPPAGYEIPTTPVNTAAGYLPITRSASGEMTAEFGLQRLEGSDENHTLLVLADVQTQTDRDVRQFHDETVPDVQEFIRGAGGEPIFGIACGDIMWDRLALYPEYERGVERVGIPFLQVIGNHDLDLDGWTDAASAATFRGRYGPAHRSFDRGAVHYAILDDVFWHGAGYLGYLTEEQLTWLTNDLKRVESGRPVVVCLHIPVRGGRFLRVGDRSPPPTTSVTNRQALYRLLEPYDAHVICGHTHETEHVFAGGLHEHVSGTVCGAWWTGPICADGTPNGYSVYEIRGEQVTWRYKCTGLDANHQMRAYPRGVDPAAPTEMVVNVWNWDPEWTVVWYDNGEPRGPMARRVGYDPLSVELHGGSEQPVERSWVDPFPTEHLFYAPVGPGAHEITVEATDRFGRRYTSKVPQHP